MNITNDSDKIIEKENFDVCFLHFKQLIINDFSLENIIDKAYNSDLDSYKIRGIIWKIFLEVVSKGNDLKLWATQTKSQRRKYYDKYKELSVIKRFSEDPLSNKDKNNSWNSIQEQNDVKKIINLDLHRTYQDYTLFRNEYIRNMLHNILFLWAQLNPDVSYKQGMNEIAALLLISVYPYYVENTKLYSKFKMTHKQLLEKVKSSEVIDNDFTREIYLYLFDESCMEPDLFNLFDSIMKRGLKDIYYMPDINFGLIKQNSFLVNKHFELFQLSWSEELSSFKKKVEEESFQIFFSKVPMHKRINCIFENFLYTYDPELHDYLRDLDTEASVFLQRWLRCLLIREFDLSQILSIWDAILAYDAQQIHLNSNFIPNLDFVDYISVYMIHCIRNDLLDKDLNTVYQKLLKYPKQKINIQKLTKISLKIKEDIKDKEKEWITKLHKKPKSNFSKAKLNQSMTSHELENETKNSTMNDNRISLNSNRTKSSKNSKNRTTFAQGKLGFDEISKLEHIYLKYKNQFSLKDSREFLVTLVKLKFNK